MIGNAMLFVGSETKPPKHATDDVCAEPLIAVDETTFAEFYKRYERMVHGIILARAPYDDVDDIAQEVFLAAYKHLGSLRNHDAAGPWLGTIARNQVIAFYRRTRPAEEITADFARSENAHNEAGEVMAAIHALPLAYAETLVLRLVEGMTGPEIAERTGLTSESVRVNLHRGMKLLRQKLGITE